MHLVELDEGTLGLRWTWFPYWLAVSPAMKQDVERQLNDAMLLNGAPRTVNLDAIDDLVIRVILRRFKIPGLGDYLRAMKSVGK